MTSRHHYSIPGASLLKPKSSSKPQPQKLSSSNVPGPSRDTRQPSTSRAYYSQETVYRTAPPSRPPSVSGYRSQPSPAHAGVFPTQGNPRPPPVQRPPSVTPQPQASSSKSRLEVPDPRNYFSKMFGRRPSPSLPQAEDKQKSTHKHQRSSNAQVPPPMYPTAGAIPNPPPVAATSNWAAYEASLRAREAEREERARQKAREERARGKEDRVRSEYTAHMAKVDAEQAQAAAAAKANRAERSVPRPDNKRTQEYESDTARRRQQAQPVASSTGYRQEARLSSAQHLHPTYQYPSTNATRTVTPAREAQQPPTPSPTFQNPGVPIQHSASSQSTSASNQVHTSVPAQAVPPVSTVNPVPNHTQSQAQGQNQNQTLGLPRRTTTPPPAPKVLPMYLPPGADDRARLQREAAEREVYASREREREREKDVELEKEKEREQESERAREKEERRARRAERERRRELEREKQKDLERAEREKLERKEKERLKALERAERERQREVERVERERLQEKERDRERERQHKSSKHRSYRDKTQSLPMHPTPGVTSGSDTERLNRKDRHRAQSYPTAVVAEMQPLVAPPDMRRPDYRREPAPAASLAPTGVPAAMQGSSSNQDQDMYAQFQNNSPALPVPPPLAERHDQVLYPRSTSAAATGPQTQQPSPQYFPGRPRTEINSSNDVPAKSGRTSMTQWSEPLPPAMQSKLVSIYASQGPPDRTPSHSTQKMEFNMPVGEQVAPGLMSSYPSGDGHTRPSSQDQIFHRPLTAAPSPAPTIVPTPAPGPRTSLSAIPRAPSATSLRQYIMTEQSQQPMNSTTLTTSTPSSDSQSRLDTYNIPPHEKSLPPSGTFTVPPSSAVGPQQVASSNSQRIGYDRRSSVIPALAAQVNGPNATSSINFSQPIVGPTGAQEPLQVSEQAQPSGPMSRAPSNNSARSPVHRDTLQLPAVSSNGASPAILASRSVSGASKTTEPGDQPHFQPASTHQVVSHSQQQAPPNTPATPMYSSALNSSSASRASHEPPANSHRQSVFLMHSHSLSLPSNYLQNTTENASSRPDHLLNVPAASQTHAPVADSASQQRYPYNQQSVNQQSINQHAINQQSYNQQSYNQQPFLPSNLPHNSSLNLQVPAQSQPQSQTEALQSSSSHVNSTSRTPISHTHSSHPAVAVSHLSSQKPSTTLSSQSVNPPTALYHNHFSSHFHDVPYQTQQRLQTQSTTPRPSPQQQNSNQAPYSFAKPSSATYVTTTHQSGPFGDDTPSSLGAGLSLDSPPPPIKPQTQQALPLLGQANVQSVHARPPSVIAPTSTPMRSASQTHRVSQNIVRPQDNDVPPPLTPSNSSRESHEEILMTPSSLDAARAQHQQASVSLERSDSQRSGKKKGGLFGLFRSSSRAKEAKDQGDASRYQTRRQPPGVSQGNESMSSLRSSKQQPSMAETVTKPAKVDPVPVAHHVRQTKTPKPVPPPIAIPPHSIPYRLFSSKSKRYRTMSSASVEALDGTANNTVVGSPTSSRRSTTPSGPGPLTPPLRDPIRAAKEWRNNEERVFVGRGRHRRRRPGVTFDLTDDDVPKNSSHYRLTRSSRPSGQRGDSSE